MNVMNHPRHRPGIRLEDVIERPEPVFVAHERGWYCLRIDQRWASGLQLNNYLDEVMRWRMTRPSNEIFWGNDLAQVPGYPDLPCLYGFDQVMAFGSLDDLMAFNAQFEVSGIENAQKIAA